MAAGSAREWRALQIVRQIRGLIDSGLPTRIVRDILPFLDGPVDLVPTVPCGEMIEQMAAQREQLDRRIRCLTRNRDALDVYLLAARERTAGA